MKKYLWSAFTVFCFLATMSWQPGVAVGAKNPLSVLKKENQKKVVDEIANEVVSRLPDDIHLRLLAIGPMEGDDGTLVDALTAKIKAETSFQIIERKDLDKILTEQGIQLSPITDSRRPIEPGKIKGVEGLLLGRVTRQQVSFLYASQEVFIKLNDVEGGEVVFAEDFDSNYLPPVTLYGLGGLAILILIPLYGRRRRKKKHRKAVAFVQKDAELQRGYQSELKKVKENLNSAHDDLVANDRMDLSVVVKSLKEDINALLSRIEQGAGLHPEGVDRGVKSDIKSHNKAMAGLVKNLLGTSEKVVKAARSGEEKSIRSAVEQLRTEAMDATKRFHNRPTRRA